MKLQKRSAKDLTSGLKPKSPAELEILSRWYFGKPLHLDSLQVYSHGDSDPAGSARYSVKELYNSYHGEKFLHGERCTKGYDYSATFWRFAIGELYCGGIASTSYGQAHVSTIKEVDRLKKLQALVEGGDHGRVRKAFKELVA